MQLLSSRLTRCEPWIKRAVVSFFAAFLTALWVGMLLAEADHFNAWPAIMAAIAAGAVTWRYHPRYSPEAEASAGHTGGFLATAALALITLALTLPPSEWIVGGWDPGVYMHTAGSLARTGTLLPSAPDLAALDPDARVQLGRPYEGTWQPFHGMRMMPDGRISPQFYHLYPVLMAIAWLFGGIPAALMVNPLLNIICVLALYLWASQWVRPRWAFAAALLLALNPAQVWQARFGTSELLTQCLLLGGLAMMGQAFTCQARNLSCALLAGSAFGLAMLTRCDTVLFVMPLSLILIVGIRSRSHRVRVLIILGSMAALGVQSWLHQRFLAPFYHPGAMFAAKGLIVTAAMAVLVLAGAIWLYHRTGKSGDRAPELPRWLPVAAITLFAAWAFFNWYVRPRLAIDGRVLSVITGLYPHLKEAAWFPLLAGRNARNFWYLQSIFGICGFVVALTGICVLISRSRSLWKTAGLAAGLFVMVILITMIYHEPFMMFVSRRLIPVIIPLLCLGAAAACDTVESRLRHWPRIATGAAVIMLFAVVLIPIRNTAFMATHHEWPGLVRWYDQLASKIPPGATVYSDQPGFAAPLRFLYGFRAYELRELPPDRRTDPLEIMQKDAKRDTVMWLTETEAPDAMKARLIKVTELPMNSSILGSTKYTVPRHTRPRGGAFRLYQILPAPEPPATSLP